MAKTKDQILAELAKRRLDTANNLLTSSKLDELMFNDKIVNRNDSSRRYMNKFSRFGFIDPYTTPSSAREYLFFTKPDLNLLSEAKTTSSEINLSNTNTDSEDDGLSGTSTVYQTTYTANENYLNPTLSSYPKYIGWQDRYVEVMKELQYSLNKNDPFMHMLSNAVRNTLDIPDVSYNQLETSTNIYGTNITYSSPEIKSDEDHSFTLEFEDSRNLEVYTLFEIWADYELKKSLGIIEPLDPSYVYNKILHDQIAIYKFVVDDDNETLLFWAKMYGARPESVPRSTFSDTNSNLPFKYSISWKADMVEIMDPLILLDFNELTSDMSGKELPLFDTTTMDNNMEWASFARITQTDRLAGAKGRPDYYRYKLKWYK